MEQCGEKSCLLALSQAKPYVPMHFLDNLQPQTVRFTEVGIHSTQHVDQTP